MKKYNIVPRCISAIKAGFDIQSVTTECCWHMAFIKQQFMAFYIAHGNKEGKERQGNPKKYIHI